MRRGFFIASRANRPLNKTTVLMRASFLQLRPYLWVILDFIAAGILANVIVSLSLGDNSENMQVSSVNLLTVFLLFVGSVLPSLLY